MAQVKGYVIIWNKAVIYLNKCMHCMFQREALCVYLQESVSNRIGSVQ